MDDFMERLPLARHRIDRDDAARGGPALWRDLADDPRTRILPVRRAEALVRNTSQGPSVVLVARRDLPADLDFDDAVHTGAAAYLGRTLDARRGGEPAGTRVVALTVDDDTEPFGPAGAEWRGLRDVAIDLDDTDAGLFTQALAMHHWHVAHRFAPDTGEALRAEHAGWVRRPESGSGRSHFPRTDAAIITAVVDRDDRLLLGANVQWTPRRYSLLAGFVEPGESFEAAVVREIWEESGARVVNPRYLGSQPWPFPASIMVGFIAELDPEQNPADVRPDQQEIADLRWFTRDEIAAESHLLPPRISIARAIIEEWYGGPIPD